MQDTVYFTICSKNYMAYARTLYYSLKRFYPDLEFYLALCDSIEGLDNQPFNVIQVTDLNIPDLQGMSERYNITEFNTAIKPFVFAYLLSGNVSRNVVYLDPDIFVVSRMEELDNALASDVQAVLTPHITLPAEGCEVHDQKMLQFGIYNLGFIALKNNEAVREFVEWWCRKLESHCIIDLENGLFVDQKWMDLLPALLDRVLILRHQGYNIAYWNLSQRVIKKHGDEWFSNKDRIRFVHFSGNNLEDRQALSRHSGEFHVGNIGDLAELLDIYRKSVFENGHDQYSKLEYAYNWSGKSGVNLHAPEPRREVREVREEGSDENEEVSEDNIVQYTNGQEDNSKISLSRIMSVYRSIIAVKEYSGGWLGLVSWIIRKIKSSGFRDAYDKAKHNLRAREEERGQEFESNQVQALETKQVKIKALPTRKNTLLYIDWSTPRVDQDAGSATTYNLLKILVDIGLDVTFVPNDLERLESYSSAVEELGVKCLFKEDIGSIDEYITSCGSGYQFYLLCRAPIAGLYIDLIKQYCPYSTVLFNTSDVHYIRDQREVELTGEVISDEKREYLESQKENELDVIKKSDVSIVMSTHEYEVIYNELPMCDIRQIPLMFIDIHGSGASYDERRDVLFIGGFRHLPNVDAVLYFCQEIWPLVRESIPDITFYILGSSPPEAVMELNDLPGVTVIGYVPDLNTYFNRIRVSVAPLRYGAGIKGKIGTSLGLGVPVVATSIAAEGMKLKDGVDIVLANDPAQFAERLITLYENEDDWSVISKNGLNTVSNEYSYDIGLERINELFKFSVPEEFQLEVSRFDNKVEYDTWCDDNKEALDKRRSFELGLLQQDEEPFRLSGDCVVCKSHSEFNVAYMYAYDKATSGKLIPNWREHLDCIECGLVNRVRASMHYFMQEMCVPPASHIYITEQVTPLYRWLSGTYKNVVGSEYFGEDYKFGDVVNGVRNENLMDLTFDNDAFDYVLSFDVLEHVPFPLQAFEQIFRCLKPGGQLLFTAPFSSTDSNNTIRATLSSNGEIEHHLPPEYHGNPVDHENGALCFLYYGWEVLDQMRDIGFIDCKALNYWSDKFAYLGKAQFLFTAMKPLS